MTAIICRLAFLLKNTNLIVSLSSSASDGLLNSAELSLLPSTGYFHLATHFLSLVCHLGVEIIVPSP